MLIFDWFYGIILLHAFTCVYATHENNDVSCKYAPGLTVGNRSTEFFCCNQTSQNYHRQWFAGRSYLTGYLESLKTWRCPQYKEECSLRTFAYTDFSALVYTRFCNDTSVLEEKCYYEVRSVVQKQANVALQTSTWAEVVRNLDLSVISDEDLLRPCIQIAMYDIDSGGHGHYHEVVEPIAPFCSFVWCGFDESVVSSKHISAWTCLPSR